MIVKHLNQDDAWVSSLYIILTHPQFCIISKTAVGTTLSNVLGMGEKKKTGFYTDTRERGGEREKKRQTCSCK